MPFRPIRPYRLPCARVKLAPDLYICINYGSGGNSSTDKIRLDPKLTSIDGRWISLVLFLELTESKGLI